MAHAACLSRAFRAVAPLLLLAIAAARATDVSGASLTVKALLPDGQPLARAVVTAVSPDLPSQSPVQAVVDQIAQRFVPDLLVVPVNSLVEFPNSDTVSHQVYSFSPAKRFQLPLYTGKAYPPLMFEREGLVVLGCNIHDSMVAHLVVTEAPFFGITDASGEWSVTDMPAGTYTVRLWHPRSREASGALERSIVVSGEETSRLTLRLERTVSPLPIEGKPRSWDRY